MTAAMGLGAVFGGLWVAARGKTGVQALVVSSTLFGLAILSAALAPVMWLELVALMLTGAASVGFLSKGNSTIQLAADPQMRGRVMALWSVAFLGSTPIGGPIAGAVASHWGGRAGLFLGAITCLVAAAMGLAIRRRIVLGRQASQQSLPPIPADEYAEPTPTAPGSVLR
jgi:MFS family permease